MTATDARGRSPAHRQYLAIKERYPDAIVLFRLGDFYEMFGDDARTGARVLQITLTSREFAKGDRVPMAGIPYHALAGYLKRFVQHGLKVAVCEQLTEPGRGLVERDVVRVVSPGTLIEPALLDEKQNNFLAAVHHWKDSFGLAWVDVTTGEFAVTQFDGSDAAVNLEMELLRLAPAETLVPAEPAPVAVPGHLTLHDEYRFNPDAARSALCRQFRVQSLEGFGCEELAAAVGAAGAILSYVERANRSLLGLLAGLRTYTVSSFMTLDRYTRRNLELTESTRSGGVQGSLLWVLDRTQTAMGGRRLRRQLGQPLLEVAALEHRLDAVETLCRDPVLRARVRAVLSRIADLERLTGRVCGGSAAPADLLTLRSSLLAVAELPALLGLRADPAVAHHPVENHPVGNDLVGNDLVGNGSVGTSCAGPPVPAAGTDGPAREVPTDERTRTDEPASCLDGLHSLADVRSRLDGCEEVCSLIEAAIPLDTPDRVRDARPGGEGLIRPGFNAELDAVKASIRDSRDWIARLEPQEQARTGIRSLKVGYNKVFGFYLEVSTANLGAVPPEYVRKQTLVNAERFITPDLKEHEARILQAEERIGALEREIFADLQAEIAGEAPRLFATAEAVAELDVYASLAEVAERNGYVRPELSEDDRLEIRAGRHPVVEVTRIDEGFIPNDCLLDTRDRQIVVLTGPNMGGKSTFLRQVALCVLLAQIGSFVPAERAHIGLVDRLFTRVGAQDDIASGQSTFMVEMVETANILHHATARSLLVLDEVGRGTSTYDGLAIARAVLEHIHDRIGARTLFATHYHELTALADRMARIHNAHVAVAEDEDRVILLHRVVPGGADRSYGTHVARIAGLPAAVTARAEEVLADLEERAQAQQRGRGRSRTQQLTLFGEADGVAARIVDDLLALDITGITPLEALGRLHEWQQKARGG